MNADQRPIGVFDSGVGGLTVLRHLLQLLPNERFVYLGDTARVPYGNKSRETVQLYAKQCAAFLRMHDVKLIVVACNTASALALDELRGQLDIPAIGVIIPAAKQAVLSTRNGHIGVIGTRATISSASYEQSIRLASGSAFVTVHSQACPLFVPLVEEGWLDTPATRLVAEEYVHNLREQNIDTLVLGCTHYPLLAPVLRDLLPGVTLVDCGACAAADAQKAIVPASRNDGQHSLELYVTDQTPSFSKLASSFLGIIVNEPILVSIDHVLDKEKS